MVGQKEPGFVFVVGASRSGTTMAARMLGRHSRIRTFPELHFFEELWTPGEARGRTPRNDGAPDLAARLYSITRIGYLEPREPERFRTEANQLLAAMPREAAAAPAAVFRRFLQAETGREGKTIACDQTPRNVFYLAEILREFPEARIVNMVRDPRAVLLSQKNRWRRRAHGGKVSRRQMLRQLVNYHPLTTGKLWSSSIHAADRFRDDPRMLTLNFEWCVEDGERFARRLCEFLDLEYEPDMPKVPLVGSSLVPDRRDQMGIDASRASAWRRGGLRPAEVRLCQRIVGADLLRTSGYAPEPVHGEWLRTAALVALWPFELAAAVAFSLARTRNFAASLRRRLGARSGGSAPVP